VIASLAQLAETAAEAAKALASPDLLAPLTEADGSPWHRPLRPQRQRGKRRGVGPQPPKGPSQAALEVRAQEAADFLAGRLLRG
jgi:hypothetical protein